MIGAVLKVIIFTSMVNRIINTSRNERVTQQVRCDGLHSRCNFSSSNQVCSRVVVALTPKEVVTRG